MSVWPSLLLSTVTVPAVVLPPWIFRRSSASALANILPFGLPASGIEEVFFISISFREREARFWLRGCASRRCMLLYPRFDI